MPPQRMQPRRNQTAPILGMLKYKTVMAVLTSNTETFHTTRNHMIHSKQITEPKHKPNWKLLCSNILQLWNILRACALHRIWTERNQAKHESKELPPLAARLQIIILKWHSHWQLLIEAATPDVGKQLSYDVYVLSYLKIQFIEMP